MAETVTIRDVARHAGVGVGTVSRVLNDSQSVRESTRLKVLAAIDDLHYSPSPVARRLSRGKTMAIGVIVPFFTNASVVKRLQGVSSIVAKSDYDLVLFDVENVENRDTFFSKIVQRKLVDGLLIVSLKPNPSDMEYILKAQIPVVSVDVKDTRVNSIIVDNVCGGKIATRHLIELGHKKIAHVSDYPDNPFNHLPVQDRIKGYRSALTEAGLPYREEYYRFGDLNREEACRLANEILTLPDPPTAIFAYCDTQAFGVIEAARDLGLRVPEDLSVIGFDDIDAAEFAQLTTIRQSLHESGVRGAELMLQVLDDPSMAPAEIHLPTELVVRRTTAEPLT